MDIDNLLSCIEKLQEDELFDKLSIDKLWFQEAQTVLLRQKEIMKDEIIGKKWKELLKRREELFGKMSEPTLYTKYTGLDGFREVFILYLLSLHPTIYKDRMSKLSIFSSEDSYAALIFPTTEEATMFYDMFEEDIKEYSELLISNSNLDI